MEQGIIIAQQQRLPQRNWIAQRNRILQQFIAIFALIQLACFTAFTAAGSPGPLKKAATAENFNSREGTPVKKVKASLQNACWTFHHFDINHNGWNPGMEGDGAMVSDGAVSPQGNSGIYTPLLSVDSDLSISFDYTFDNNFSGDTRRWMRIGLVNPATQEMQLLETVEFDGVNALRKKNYNTLFSNLAPGSYRLALIYGGTGGAARIAVDGLSASAPLLYEGGCNTVPAAHTKEITGMSNRTASAMLLDKNESSRRLVAFLIEGSPDGKISLHEDGNLSFTPAPGFSGNSTSFVYKVCDDPSTGLCSENMTARIHFPDLPAPAGLLSFSGAYRQNGNVDLLWAVGSSYNKGYFEVERMIDGRQWEKAGTIQTATGTTGKKNYVYTDKLNRQAALKKDIYYRLKQVNEDGSTSMSRLLIVRVYNTKTLSTISVTPNPGNNDIGVNVQLHENSYVSMRVLDDDGKSVLHSSLEAHPGTNQFSVDGSSALAAGPYLLEVIVNSKERMLVKLLKE